MLGRRDADVTHPEHITLRAEGASQKQHQETDAEKDDTCNATLTHDSFLSRVGESGGMTLLGNGGRGTDREVCPP
jgi:hypothetical protein